MGRIFINVSGDGTCYAIPNTVTNLETFTLYAIPFEGATLEDLRAWTSFDESIAISVTQEQQITYRTEWRNVYIDAYFSGGVTPVDPEPPTVFDKYLWLLFKMKKNRRQRNGRK